MHHVAELRLVLDLADVHARRAARRLRRPLRSAWRVELWQLLGQLLVPAELCQLHGRLGRDVLLVRRYRLVRLDRPAEQLPVRLRHVRHLLAARGLRLVYSRRELWLVRLEPNLHAWPERQSAVQRRGLPRPGPQLAVQHVRRQLHFVGRLVRHVRLAGQVVGLSLLRDDAGVPLAIAVHRLFAGLLGLCLPNMRLAGHVCLVHKQPWLRLVLGAAAVPGGNRKRAVRRQRLRLCRLEL